MAIRKVVTRSMADNAVTTGKIVDGTIATADLANSAVTDAKIAAGSGGAGAFQGDNASGALNGDTTNGKKDIFRVHETTSFFEDAKNFDEVSGTDTDDA